MPGKRKVVILHRHRFELWNEPGWVPQRLARDFPELDVVHLDSYDELEGAIGDAEIYIGWSIRAEQFVTARRLRWIHSPTAAVHQLLLPEVVASPVVITNARSVHGPVVAESVMALLLALARRLPSAVRYQQRHEWAQKAIFDERTRPRELRGATLLLVGYGSIGREVARRALAFEMKVVVTREHPEPQPGIDVHSSDELDSLLPTADFIVLAAPLTPKTTALMNRERFARMKPDAYLFNVGRGPVVDEAALLAALKEKKIGGAALDVFVTEPLPQDSPLWDAPNLLVTPHMTAITAKDTLWERHYELIAENMRRWLIGRELLNLVDKSKGY